MNSENSKSSKSHVLILNLTDKIDLRRGEKSVGLSNRSIYYAGTNIKKLYSNNKYNVSAPTWNKEFEFPGGSYSMSNVQDYFKYF